MGIDVGSKRFLDARGLECPEPVMLLHKEIREMTVGDELVVYATDPSTQRDIPNFCLHLKHQLIDSTASGKEFHYLLMKGQK